MGSLHPKWAFSSHLVHEQSIHARKTVYGYTWLVGDADGRANVSPMCAESLEIFSNRSAGVRRNSQGTVFPFFHRQGSRLTSISYFLSYSFSRLLQTVCRAVVEVAVGVVAVRAGGKRVRRPAKGIVVASPDTGNDS
jgi:hypothetical protein